VQELTALFRRGLESVDQSWAAGNPGGAPLPALHNRGITHNAAPKGPSPANKITPKGPASPSTAKKATPKGPAPPSPGKKATPKKCHVKKPHKRSLDKRASKTVREGTVDEGDEADQLSTYQLRTCIGVIAVSGKKKAMAHINAVNAAGKDYKAQLAAFTAKAHSLGGSVKVYGTYPNKQEGGAALANTLGWMIYDIGTAAKSIDTNYEFIERPLHTEGDMMVDKDGNVIMDDCSYSH
jgi:hypothetical protein